MISLGCLVAFAGLLSSGCSRSEARAKRPNVLMIVLDTVRADHLSTYGYERETSPNLTRLARSGARFDHVVATAPWTVPSHASVFTGLLPSEHGAHHEHWRLRPDVPTLPEDFQRSGYRTGGLSANPFVGKPSGLHRGFDEFDSVYSGGRDLTDRAIAFVQSGPEPWFLFLNYMEAHLPFGGVPKQAQLRFLPHAARGALTVPFKEQLNAFAYACAAKRPAPRAIQDLTALYDAAITYLDGLIGVLLDGLGDARSRTLIVVLSDHGELLGEHALIEHQFSVWEPLLRIPLIVSQLGVIPPGTAIETPMSATEIHRIVRRLAGLEPGSTLDASDPFGLAGRAKADLVSEYYRPKSLLGKVGERFPDCVSGLDQRMTSVRRGDHKLIWRSDGSTALFDLRVDPEERHDVRIDHEELTQALEAVVAARQKAAGAATAMRKIETPRLDDETRDRLRVLGYGE
jgi:arylsulfatase A-like enzyme